jgi:hypothetical protein
MPVTFFDKDGYLDDIAAFAVHALHRRINRRITFAGVNGITILIVAGLTDRNDPKFSGEVDGIEFERAMVRLIVNLELMLAAPGGASANPANQLDLRVGRLWAMLKSVRVLLATFQGDGLRTKTVGWK